MAVNVGFVCRLVATAGLMLATIGMPVNARTQVSSSHALVATNKDPASFVRMLYRNDSSDKMVIERHWNWRIYLSKRTNALLQKVYALYPGESTSSMEVGLSDSNDGNPGISSLSVIKGPGSAMTATVKMARSGDVVRLILIQEQGWKIDDVIDSQGIRLSSLASADIRSARHR